MTKGYRLPAKFVIHAVGPVWRGGGHGEEKLLAGCYRRALELACRQGLGSVAFPCISAGAYGYPAEEAAKVAIGTVRRILGQLPGRIEATFCCYSAESGARYERLGAEGTVD